MTKAELFAILARYDDDQLVLVESQHGFEVPQIYVAAVRPRRAGEFGNAFASDYVPARPAELAEGALIIGTAAGFLQPS